jgi:hypothetical protein
MTTLNPELRQQIVRAAHRQRNVEVWRLLGRLYAALMAQPKRLRPSRWLAVRHSW